MSEVCPNGHVGRGMLLEMDTQHNDDGSVVERNKFECELCGEIWWDELHTSIDDENENQS